MAKIFLNC